MKKRVAVIVNKKQYNTVMQNHLKELLNDDEIELGMLLVDSFNENKLKLKTTKKLLSIVIRLTNMSYKLLDIIIKNKRYEHDEKLNIHDFISSHDLKDISENLDTVKLSKYRSDLSKEQIQKLNTTCDVIILLGIGRLLDGKILECTKHGVLSFHPADIRKYRGRPSGFHEWINCEEYLGITVQRLSKEIDGGEIITERSVNLKKNRSLVSASEEMRVVRKGMIVEGVYKIFSNNQKFEKPDYIKHNIESGFYTNRNVFKYVKRHLIKC